MAEACCPMRNGHCFVDDHEFLQWCSGNIACPAMHPRLEDFPFESVET